VLDTAVRASYIILAKSLPRVIAIPDELSMDKLSRSVWGEGKWVSSAAVEPTFVVGGVSGLYRKRKTREKGKTHAVSPLSWACVECDGRGCLLMSHDYVSHG